MSNINEKNLGPRWYVAHTYTGYENKVKSSIERIVENRGLGHLIYDVKIPVEITVEVDEKGEEKTVENKIFPSYVLVKMTMTDESWHAVRTIPGVTGFVGPGSEPEPLTDEEVEMFNVGLWRKLGHALVGRAMLSRTSIQLSADGWGCILSLLVWPEAT